MAQDRTADLEASLLQGVRGVENNVDNIRERLAKLFTPTDLVKIKNILPTQFGWVYTDPRETVVEQPDPATRRVSYGEPKARVLQPGETKTITGWEAYIALERMWKEHAQRDLSRIAQVLQSSIEMTAFIDEAYLGTYDPDAGETSRKDLGFAVTAPAPSNDRTAVAENKVALPPTQDDNLGFDDEEPQQPPQTQVPPLNDGNDGNGNDGQLEPGTQLQPPAPSNGHVVQTQQPPQNQPPVQ